MRGQRKWDPDGWVQRCAAVWYWCLHCERVYRPGDAVRDGDAWRCPGGCSASTYVDWMQLRHAVMGFGLVVPAQLERGLQLPAQYRPGDGRRHAS